MRFFYATILTAVIFTGSVRAQSDTAFTYQGSLNDASSPANGDYSIRFLLYDALAGGTQIGSTFVVANQAVTDGLFTAEIDFGANAFDNNPRWLAIVIDGTTLSPRQSITRTPYSIQTRGINVNDFGYVGIGTTTPNYPLHVISSAGRSIYGRSTSENQGVGVYGRSEGASGHGVFGWATAADGVTYGVLGRSSSTSGRGMYGWASADSGTTYGVLGRNGSPTGYGMYGVSYATTGVNYGVYGATDSVNGRGTYGLASSNTGVNYGVVGRSNSPDGYDFFASGAGTNYGASSSRRWKNNIVNIDNPLDKLASLRGVYFDWDEEHGGFHDVGMIAEEVGKVLPEIVNYEENGIDAIGMDYSKMTPLLVEALNALRAENSELRERLDQLESIVGLQSNPVADATE